MPTPKLPQLKAVSLPLGLLGLHGPQYRFLMTLPRCTNPAQR